MRDVPGGLTSERVSTEREPLLRQETRWPGRNDLTLGWTLQDAEGPDRSIPDIASTLGSWHRRTPHYLRQVHGTDIILLTSKTSGSEVGSRGDGFLTDQTGLLVGVNVADCLPLFVRAGHVYGVLHAGWRGVIGGMLPVALGVIQQHFRLGVREAEIVVGPGIGPCCFEVSAAVWGLFEKRHRLQRGGRLYVDLISVLQSQWRRCGGIPSSFLSLSRCTVCSEPALHSYRREHTTGRNYAYIVS